MGEAYSVPAQGYVEPLHAPAVACCRRRILSHSGIRATTLEAKNMRPYMEDTHCVVGCSCHDAMARSDGHDEATSDSCWQGAVLGVFDGHINSHVSQSLAAHVPAVLMEAMRSNDMLHEVPDAARSARAFHEAVVGLDDWLTRKHKVGGSTLAVAVVHPAKPSPPIRAEKGEAGEAAGGAGKAGKSASKRNPRSRGGSGGSVGSGGSGGNDSEPDSSPAGDGARDVDVVSVGDSRVFVLNLNDRTARCVTRDHVLTRKGEKSRVQNAGGHIVSDAEGRIGVLGINMTRTMGDAEDKQHALPPEHRVQSCAPDVTRVRIRPHEALLLCSDGLYEDAQWHDVAGLDPATQAQRLAACLRRRTAAGSYDATWLSRLVADVSQRSEDNITAMLVQILPSRTAAAAAAYAATTTTRSRSELHASRLFVPSLIGWGEGEEAAQARAVMLKEAQRHSPAVTADQLRRLTVKKHGGWLDFPRRSHKRPSTAEPPEEAQPSRLPPDFRSGGPRKKFRDAWTALDAADRRSTLAVLDAAFAGSLPEPKHANCRSDWGRTPLHLCFAGGHAAAARRWLKSTSATTAPKLLALTDALDNSVDDYRRHSSSK